MRIRIDRKSARIELIPLVDIIFLLLVFFIYSMLSMAVYRGIPVALPQAETVESVEGEAVFITVNNKGLVFVDQVFVDKDFLLDRLKKEKTAFPKKTAIISADGHAPYKAFVDVLDKVRLAGFKKVSMEAKQEKTQSE